MTKKDVCVWDLEGPISILDFAGELGKKLMSVSGQIFSKYDMGAFFSMLSLYDDFLIDTPDMRNDLGIPDYQPGDTLRLIAPLYVLAFDNTYLIRLAEKNLGLLPGCEELFRILKKKWDIFIISTSYSQFALTIAKKLNIPRDHVYCTQFNIDDLKRKNGSLKEEVELLIQKIFVKYLKNNKSLEQVIDDLNSFFWSDKAMNYVELMNEIEVLGGIRKELAVLDISEITSTPISEMVSIGDSITDINMLQRVKSEGGIAISFNGNRYSIPQANIALTAVSNLGVLPIFEKHQNLDEFLLLWQEYFPVFSENPQLIPKDLLSERTRDIFKKYNFVPEIDYLEAPNSNLDDIIRKQETMRKFVRGWAGNLG
ncbi:MAG: HAD hydrolase family protein [Promethearchaeota archaeon]